MGHVAQETGICLYAPRGRHFRIAGHGRGGKFGQRRLSKELLVLSAKGRERRHHVFFCFFLFCEQSTQSKEYGNLSFILLAKALSIKHRLCHPYQLLCKQKMI